MDRDNAGRGVLSNRRALQPRAVQRAGRHHLPRDRDLRPLERLQPSRPRPATGVLVAPATRLPPPADGLAEQKTFGETGVPLTAPGVRRLALLPARAPRPPATEGRDRSDPDSVAATTRGRLAQRQRNRWHRPFANNLLKIWPALWTFTRIDGVEPTNNPAERVLRGPGDPPKTLTRHSKPERRTVRRARALRRRRPAACNAARCSPTSANSCSHTPAATRSPHSPDGPRD